MEKIMPNEIQTHSTHCSATPFTLGHFMMLKQL